MCSFESFFWLVPGSKAEVVAALLAVGAADSALGPDQRRDLGRDREDTNVVVEDPSNKSSLKLAPSNTLDCVQFW